MGTMSHPTREAIHRGKLMEVTPDIYQICVRHTQGQAPCSAAIGQHRMDCMILCVLFIVGIFLGVFFAFLFYFVFACSF